MRGGIDYFQLAALTALILLFIGRSLYLWLAEKVNPFSLGIGKSGLRRLVELGFLAGLLLWAAEVMATALRSEWRVFPSPLQWRITDARPLKFAGAVLIMTGLLIFALSLLSFGNSWRVGIDERAPSTTLSKSANLM